MTSPIPLIVFIIVVLFVVTRCDQQQALRNHTRTAHAVVPTEEAA